MRFYLGVVVACVTLEALQREATDNGALLGVNELEKRDG
jgi:hypothetical protein